MFLARAMGVKPLLQLGGVCRRCGGVFPVHLIKHFGEGFASGLRSGGPRGRVQLSSTLLLAKAMQNNAPKMLNVDHML